MFGADVLERVKALLGGMFREGCGGFRGGCPGTWVGLSGADVKGQVQTFPRWTSQCGLVNAGADVSGRDLSGVLG